MNATLNIIVRVNAQQANAAIAQQTGALRSLQNSFGSASKASAGFGGTLSAWAGHLQRFGKNLQWTGQQLTYNFTLPIVLAGAAATKWALENERAMTSVRKVYGDASRDAGELKEELSQLEVSFRLLSDRFGVHQSEVIGIGAAWAQAGFQGVALARATKLTLQTMIVGELDATRATEGLIAIQAAYRLSTQELGTVLAQLNEIENNTAISTSGLIDVITRAGGSARSAGVDVRYLAAMAAVLVPTTGSAAQAGNSLRTMMSRLMAPTKQAAAILGEMGINIDDVGWVSMNGAQRIEHLATKFDGLTQAQKAQASSLIASRWQINRFDILMADVYASLDKNVKTHSVYQTALEATSTKTKDAAGRIAYLSNYVRELNTYLSSSPQRFKQMTTMIQNALASAIAPLLPAIVALLYRVVQLTEWFGNLSLPVQQAALAFLVAIAAVGPITKLLGATMTLVSTVGEAFLFLGKSVRWAAGAFLSLGQVLLQPFKVLFLLIRFIGTQAIAIARVMTIALGSVPGIVASAWARIVPILHGVATTVFTVWSAVATFLTKIPMFVASAWINITAILSAIPNIVMFAWIKLAAVGAQASLVVSKGWALSAAFLSKIPWVLASVWVKASSIIAAIPWALASVWVKASSIIAAIPTAITKVWISASTFMATLPSFIAGAWMKAAAFMRTIPLFIATVWTKVSLFLATIPAFISRAWAAMASFLAAIPPMIAKLWLTFATFMSAIPPMIAKGWTVFTAFMIKIPAVIGAAWTTLATFVGALPAALLSQWVLIGGAIIAAVALAVYFLHDQFNDAVNAVIRAFNKLPQGIIRVLLAVIQIIKKAALAAYEWLSYLNPFARHSPSIVEQVIKGVDVIAKQYARLSNIGAVFRQAISDMQAFKNATSAFVDELERMDRAQARIAIGFASGPKGVASYDAALGSIGALKGTLPKLEAEIKNQKNALNKWQAELDKINTEIKEAEALLKQLEAAAKAAHAALDGAKDEYSRLSSVGIRGQKAMNDAIFANEMAQKRLRLEMLKLGGVGFEDTQKKLSKLQGAIEAMQTEISDLRGAGAGSDVLGPLEQELDLMKEQRDVLTGMNPNLDPLAAMEAQLAQIRHEGELLELQNSITFDPLLRQIDEVINGSEEMDFSTLLSALASQKALVASLESAAKSADAAVAAQQLTLEGLNAEKEKIQEAYDREAEKLDELEQAYGDVETQIREMETALADFASQAQTALDEALRKAEEVKQKMADAAGSGGMSSFEAAGQGDFEVPGGTGGAIFEEGSLEEFNKQLEEELDKSLQELSKFDLFAPFKDMWKTVWDWLKENVGPYVKPVVDAINDYFDGANFDSIKEKFEDIFASDLISTGAEELSRIFDSISQGVQDMVDSVSEELEKWGIDWQASIDLVTIAKGIIIGMIAAVILTWKMMGPIVSGFITGVFKAVTGVVTGIVKIIGGLVTFISGILDGDLGKAFVGIVGIFQGLWDTIAAVMTGPIVVIMNLAKGLVDGIINVFTWLWDVLVGHSIVPDIVNAIMALWSWLSENIIPVVMGIANFIIDAWANVIWPAIQAVAGFIMDTLIPAFKTIFDVASDIFPKVAEFIVGAWTNFIQPAFQAIWSFITSVLVPIFRTIWDTVSSVFTSVRDAISFAWTSVISPIFNAIWGFIRDTLVPAFGKIWEKVKEVFDSVKEKVEDIWGKVKAILEPAVEFLKEDVGGAFVSMKDKAVEAFNSLKDKVKSIWDSIGGAVKDGVNLAIDAINALIGGLNAVAGILPGININIGKIPRLAAGGQMGGIGGAVAGALNVPGFASGTNRINPTATRVGSGFSTNLPRAIVGEGSAIHPEFVIPTDPKYRSRAMALFSALGNKLGGMSTGGGGRSAPFGAPSGHNGAGVPMFAWGGVPGVGDVIGTIKNAGESVIGKVKEGAVNLAFEPFKKMAQGLLDQITWNVPKEAGTSILTQVETWVKGVNDEVDKELAASLEPSTTGLNEEFLRRYNEYNAAVGGKFSIISGFRSYAQQAELYRRYLAGTGNLAAPPGRSNHEKGLAIDHGPHSTASDRAVAETFRLHYPVGGEPWHVEPFAKGGMLPLLTRAYEDIRNDKLNKGVFAGMAMDSYDSMFSKQIDASLANGGRIAHRPGGALLQVGEGRTDEQVQILPVKKDDEGGKTLNFYGDLVFPNIRTAEDAESFVRNLENMSG